MSVISIRNYDVQSMVFKQSESLPNLVEIFTKPEDDEKPEPLIFYLKKRFSFGVFKKANPESKTTQYTLPICLLSRGLITREESDDEMGLYRVEKAIQQYLIDNKAELKLPDSFDPKTVRMLVYSNEHQNGAVIFPRFMANRKGEIYSRISLTKVTDCGAKHIPQLLSHSEILDLQNQYLEVEPFIHISSLSIWNDRVFINLRVHQADLFTIPKRELPILFRPNEDETEEMKAQASQEPTDVPKPLKKTPSGAGPKKVLKKA